MTVCQLLDRHGSAIQSLQNRSGIYSNLLVYDWVVRFVERHACVVSARRSRRTRYYRHILYFYYIGFKEFEVLGS